MENKRFGNLGEYAKESAHKEYVYSRLPENIRQIGETNGNLKIYIEDYVMTYIHQIFTEKQEKAVVVFRSRQQAVYLSMVQYKSSVILWRGLRGLLLINGTRCTKK